MLPTGKRPYKFPAVYDTVVALSQKRVNEPPYIHLVVVLTARFMSEATPLLPRVNELPFRFTTPLLKLRLLITVTFPEVVNAGMAAELSSVKL